MLKLQGSSEHAWHEPQGNASVASKGAEKDLTSLMLGIYLDYMQSEQLLEEQD